MTRACHPGTFIRLSREQGAGPQVASQTDASTKGGTSMPSKTEKQRKFMGAELQRKREGKKTQTGMSEKELKKFASKPTKKKS
jgi:hypothetical protein